MFGMSGWVRSRFVGDRVGVVPFLGCPGGSGPVLGVAGWEHVLLKVDGSCNKKYLLLKKFKSTH